MLHVVQYSTQGKISLSMELGHIVTFECPSFRTSVCHTSVELF